jgi:hypothetical protein
LFLSVSLAVYLACLSGPALAAKSTKAGVEGQVDCPDTVSMAPKWSRSATYRDQPFAAGEESRYELKYGAVEVHVGYGYLRVEKPLKYRIPVGTKDGKIISEKRWHRVFSAEGYTGDWYKMIFAAHDKIQAFSRPWDFGASKFYINQNEEKPFSREYRREKWLDFDHVGCKVDEREVRYHDEDKKKSGAFALEPGATDALSALFRLRTLTYEKGQAKKFLVYTSEKNWWLKATPVAQETVKVAAGTFKTWKLRVRSYLGEELQQRGKLFVWIANEHPNRPMVKVEGEVTFGNIYLHLDQYKPGSH